MGHSREENRDDCLESNISSREENDGPVQRASGYPVKRFFHTENAKNGLNGNHAHTNNNGHFSWRSKSHVFKGKGEKGDIFAIFKGRTAIFSIVISIIVALFLMETMLQSNVTILLRHTEFIPGLVGFVERRSLADDFSFGDSVKFVPIKLEERFKNRMSLQEMRKQERSPVRPPRLAIVSPHLRRDSSSLYLISIATGLRELGYHLEVYTFSDGPSRSLWEDIGCSVNLLNLDAKIYFTVDWSNFEGVLVTSLEAKKAVMSLTQEPFSSIPLIWMILEDTLAKNLELYASKGSNGIINQWLYLFQRADVVVFPDYALAMMHGRLDTGNFFVIPGSPYDAWIAGKFSALDMGNKERMSMGLQKDDFVVLAVGSPFFYSAMWWEHTMVMQAVRPLSKKFNSKYHKTVKLIIFSNNVTGEYDIALQAIASHLDFPKATVQHYSLERDINSLMSVADIVLYGSLREEQGLPPILIRAMSFEKPIIVPNLTFIDNHIRNKTNGLAFLAGSVESMTQMMSLTISQGKLSVLAHKIASNGKALAKNLLATDAIVGYANLLEKILQFPSESTLPNPTTSLSDDVKSKWQWKLMESLLPVKDQEAENSLTKRDENQETSNMLLINEDLWNTTGTSLYVTENGTRSDVDEVPRKMDWDDQKYMDILEEIEGREEQELEERTEMQRGAWEDLYKTARKAERLKFELNERDEGELERTGQSLCIYELYYGSGAWPFLHTGALYRAVSLYPKDRRPGADDIDAADRLPLLKDNYYRNVLCELGGNFAIANKIDTIHKTPWIGFQSWHATGRKVSLSSKAEKVLADRVQSGKDGDTVYFWAKSDKDAVVPMQVTGRESLNHFWSFCDIINAQQCRIVFENAFRKMYDLPINLSALPPMPYDGDSWSVLHSWAMPTSTFLEFVMFSRMFVDALDSQNYEEHHSNGTCVLGTSVEESKHCYCRVLELLVNVWAYHSARRMVYLDPHTGVLQEQHDLVSRKGQMWVKYFNFTLLKSMDEDLAEEADDGLTSKRWVWPLTGEVHWQGIYEREREERYRQKMEKKRKIKEKLLERLKFGYKQKSLGKYAKRSPNGNTRVEGNATDH